MNKLNLVFPLMESVEEPKPKIVWMKIPINKIFNASAFWNSEKRLTKSVDKILADESGQRFQLCL